MGNLELCRPVHPWQTLRFAARCSGTSPIRWTTQTSAIKLQLRARSLTGCERTEHSAKRAKTSSTTSNPSLVGLSGVTMQLPNWQTGRRKQTQVELVVAKVLRAELNRSRLREGAKQSRTNSKLPSSYNAEARFKLYCTICNLQNIEYTGVTKK